MRITATRPVATIVLMWLFATCGCSMLAWITRTSREWQAVQAAGGIEIGTPYRNSNGDVFLPIECDVTRLDSGMSPATPVAWVSEKSIYIRVRAELAHKDSVQHCPDADLGALPGGTYCVFYASPDGSEHPLGSIEVPAP